MSLLGRLKSIPNPPAESVDAANPGVQYVVYTHRSRLGEIAAVVGEVKGWTTVPPQKLPEGHEYYLTVMVPYGRTKEFRDRIWEEGLSLVEPPTGR